MRATALLQILLAATLALSGLAAASDAPASLRIEVEGRAPLVLTRDELGALPTATAAASDYGKAGRWQGVPMHDLLLHAGASLGTALRGPAVAQVVVVEAADGYRAAFALAEFDPALGASGAILATHRDGAPLSTSEGPFRLVVPGEQRQARWVRQVTAIRVVPLP